MDGVFTAPQAVEPELFGRDVSSEEIRAWREETLGQAGSGPDARIVLFVGRLVRDKGVDVLLRAWRRLGRADDAVLCLIGDGPLAERAREAGSDIVLAGRMERERLPVAYAAASMVVVPSIATRRFLEPWGLVCNEAMHQGTPVVASAAVGAVAGALVVHGATGLVVRAGDDRELALAIAQLLDDEPLRERLSHLAKTGVERFNYDAAADAFGKALASAGAARA